MISQLKHLEALTSARVKQAYQKKAWKQPNIHPWLRQAYLWGYNQYSKNPDLRTLTGLLALYKEEERKHFKGPLEARDPLQASQSDTFTKYWLYSFANRGVLAAGLESSGYTRKVWLAQLDIHTSDICSHLNGEVRLLESDFSFANFTGLAPPAHFKCRSLIRLLP